MCFDGEREKEREKYLPSSLCCRMALCSPEFLFPVWRPRQLQAPPSERLDHADQQGTRKTHQQPIVEADPVELFPPDCKNYPVHVTPRESPPER